MTSNDSQESSAIPAMESASETVRRIFGNDGSSLGARLQMRRTRYERLNAALFPLPSRTPMPGRRQPEKAASARQQQR